MDVQYAIDIDPQADEQPVLDVADVIALEQELAASGTSLLELMQCAGAAVAEVACTMTQSDAHIVILVGSGNNGGDGWVAAELLAQTGHSVTLITKAPAESISAEPACTAAIRAASGARFSIIVSPDEEELRALLAQADLIIDAILGTGFTHAQVRTPYDAWIRSANAARTAHGTPILAVDCPSGLSAQTGEAATDTVQADRTVTMLAVKPGLLKPAASPLVGTLCLAPLVGH